MKAKEWIAFASCLAGGAGLWCLITYAVEVGVGGWKPEWVQAIGSIAAVIFSAGIAMFISARQQRHQQREADDLRRMEKIDVLLNLYALSDTAKTHVSIAHLMFSKADQGTIDQYWNRVSPGKHFEYVIHALEQVPLYSVPGEGMVKQLLFLRDCAQKALIAIDRTRFRAYSTDKTVNKQRAEGLEIILGIIEDTSAHIRGQTEKEAALVHHQERVSNLFPNKN